MPYKSNNSRVAQTAQKNKLLSNISPDELSTLDRVATSYNATLREVLYEKGDAIESVLFPINALGSILTELTGETVEAITVGREGMMGLSLFHGFHNHRAKGICQMSGQFLSIPAADFERLIGSLPELTRSLHRYSQYTHDVLSQSVACNGTHLIEQRLARWLLTTSDAVDSTSFSLTQEFLSQMLAVRRPGVVVAMKSLERRGLIGHEYGSVTIVDRSGLAKAACECYDVIHGLEQELLS